MRDRLHLAIDFDDVVCDFVHGVCEAVSRDFGVEVAPEHVVSWDFGQYIDEAIGRSWWAWLEDHAAIWGEKFRPTNGALGSLEKLRADGHYLELVTSKPRWAERPLWTWLAKYDPPFHRVTIINAEHQGPYESQYATKNKATASDADLLVDDRVRNCEDFARDGRLALLFERPHNLAELVDPTLEGVYRAADWHAVLKSVDLASERLL